jgi:acetyl-CoA carboxylase biotin carboxyl carrier protein
MDTKLIAELIKLIEDSSVEEIEITKPLIGKIRISKKAAVVNGNSMHLVTQPQAYEAKPAIAVSSSTPTETEKHAAPEVKAEKSNLLPIKSPMVGTFYRAPAPDAEPYVREGDRVEKGQVVCIVEAMKLMNEIECEHSGKIHKILVENAKPVEYGQELFLIEPL